MKIEQAMHKGAEWVAPDTPIKQIARIMKDKDIGAVPVGENERLVGIVTDRDLALRTLADGARDPATLTANDVMTKGVIHCRADQSVEDAIRLMEAKKVRRLPVIDQKRHLVGMLSLGDVSHHASREISGKLISAVAMPHD